jgi:type IV secretion system protein VirB9
MSRLHEADERWALGALIIGMLLIASAWPAGAQTPPRRTASDSRVRSVLYDPDRVYSLIGYIGYQIDLEFEPGEVFVGLGAGDVEGVSFQPQDNHLFLKPRASQVSTNLTVLTSRRRYYFDYVARTKGPGTPRRDIVYSLRFVYPPSPAAENVARIDNQLSASARPLNLDYWYCGDPSLRPVAASDDGVHTRLRFGARSELPAVFVRNDDATESLLNYTMESGDVVVHRVVRQLILRRGKLTGCVVNRSFTGGGERLDSGTVAPDVERTTRGERHEP